MLMLDFVTDISRLSGTFFSRKAYMHTLTYGSIDSTITSFSIPLTYFASVVYSYFLPIPLLLVLLILSPN